MDKQIIIDGVDVSGCVYYEGGYCTISKQAYCYCCDKPNCHYKNWQRKEQECNQLKNLFEGVQKSLEVEIEECSKWSQLETEARFELVKTQQQIDQLKKENDSLKRQLQFEFDETLLQYSNTIEDLQKQLKDSVMQKCPQCGETYLNPVGSKLYEALIEIKELVQSDYCTEIGSCEFCAEIGNCLNRKILHKISEVIDE